MKRKRLPIILLLCNNNLVVCFTACLFHSVLTHPCHTSTLFKNVFNMDKYGFRSLISPLDSISMQFVVQFFFFRENICFTLAGVDIAQCIQQSSISLVSHIATFYNCVGGSLLKCTIVDLHKIILILLIISSSNIKHTTNMLYIHFRKRKLDSPLYRDRQVKHIPWVKYYFAPFLCFAFFPNTFCSSKYFLRCVMAIFGTIHSTSMVLFAPFCQMDRPVHLN